MSKVRTPRSHNASKIALAIAGIEPTTPISPTPFAPRGLVRQGASAMLTIRKKENHQPWALHNP